MLILLALAFAVPAHGQTEARVLVGSLNLAEFPKITTYIDVRGAQGIFISALPNTAATVFEDNQPIPANIAEVRPGAQIVVAYGGGEAFNISTLNIQTRFAVIADWVMQWVVTQQGNPGDNFSLVVPEGVLVLHQTDPAGLEDALINYAPDFTQAPAPLEVLSAAIDIALEPLPAEGMGRTVLFLTQGVPEEQQATLQELVARAAAGGVRVHVGFVNSENLFSSNLAINLQAATLQTGGQYFSFSNQELLPDLELMFESSRRAYYLEYYSAANTTGEHSVQVMVNTDQAEIISNSVTYTAEIAPPIPVIIAPPTQIVRAVPEQMSNSIENLAPTTQALAVQVEFPDGIPRQISNLALYINDSLAAEVTEPPFDMISFDISGYEETENIMLRLEVTDELGMVGSSEPVPVEVLVQVPETGVFSLLGKNTTLILGGVIIISGAVLFLVLVLAGRLRPQRIGERWEKRKSARDPVTQPIDQKKLTQETPEVKQTVLDRITHRLPTTAQIPWPSRTRPTTDPYGHLVQLTEDGEPKTETTFPITTTELTFGSDPKQVVIALDNPAIAPVHARLVRDDEGTFFIEDAGSSAGTWLNYARVTEERTPVSHGDLIHIANVGYRFTLSKPNKVRETVITQKDTPQVPE